MRYTEKITEEEVELIIFALKSSKGKLQQVYTKDWLDAKIRDIHTKLQQLLNKSEILENADHFYTSILDEQSKSYSTSY